MVMSWIWTGIAGISILFAILNGNGGPLAAAVIQGAQAGVTLAISMAGSICLWSGAAAVMEAAGITAVLSKLLKPLLHRVFPSTKTAAIPPDRPADTARISARTFWGWATPRPPWAFRRQSG